MASWQDAQFKRTRKLPLIWLLRLGLSLGNLWEESLALGLALFLAPELVAATWWPWALTALAGRAVAAWLLGLGVAVAHSVWEADYGRVRAGTASLAVFGLLQFVALARYGSAVDWARPVTWGYMMLMVSFVVVGVVGWASARGK